MKERLIIDETSVYEIDEECLRLRKGEEKEKQEFSEEEKGWEERLDSSI